MTARAINIKAFKYFNISKENTCFKEKYVAIPRFFTVDLGRYELADGSGTAYNVID